MTPDLLPPNATPLERALSSAIARPDAIAFDIVALWDPATCPTDLLPWLAWGVSIDRWDPDWSEDEKRAATARAIEDQRHKGTRWAVEQVLQRFDDLLQLVEWFEATPKRAPYTFEVRLPLVDRAGVAGGKRTSAAVAQAIVAEVARAKPVRAHFDLVQTLELVGIAAPIMAAQAMSYARIVTNSVNASDTTPWAYLIQDENGEPITDDTFEPLDGSPA
ncbi:phage tail protein I [Sphingomonas sp.]|uniref:phage tail protein I n=1 Tax=Sphingomonas sp. TaxID=28214 RepID=UPI0035698C86